MEDFSPKTPLQGQNATLIQFLVEPPTWGDQTFQQPAMPQTSRETAEPIPSWVPQDRPHALAFLKHLVCWALRPTGPCLCLSCMSRKEGGAQAVSQHSHLSPEVLQSTSTCPLPTQACLLPPAATRSRSGGQRAQLSSHAAPQPCKA